MQKRYGKKQLKLGKLNAKYNRISRLMLMKTN